MSNEMTALARRLVACRGWRWMPGMLAHFEHDDRRVRVTDPACWVSTTALPNLSEPATLGCLLALVREAWRDEVMICARVDVLDDYIAPLPGGYPYSVVREGRRRLFKRSFASEAEALVAALEAAP